MHVGKLYLLWLMIVTLAFTYNVIAIPLRASFIRARFYHQQVQFKATQRSFAVFNSCCGLVHVTYTRVYSCIKPLVFQMSHEIVCQETTIPASPSTSADQMVTDLLSPTSAETNESKFTTDHLVLTTQAYNASAGDLANTSCTNVTTTKTR